MNCYDERFPSKTVRIKKGRQNKPFKTKELYNMGTTKIELHTKFFFKIVQIIDMKNIRSLETKLIMNLKELSIIFKAKIW